MLPLYFWIIFVALVDSSRESVSLPNFHHEPPPHVMKENSAKNSSAQDTKDVTVKKATEMDKTKSQLNKNEGDTLNHKEKIKNSENVETVDVNKTKVNKPQSEAHNSKTEDDCPNVTPSYIFPKDISKPLSDVIHEKSVPDEPKKNPGNESTGVSNQTEKSVEMPPSKLPTPPEQQGGTHHPNKTTADVKNKSEISDMLNSSRYNGECDVDDDKRVANKENSKKCVTKTNSTEIKKENPESSTSAGQLSDPKLTPVFNQSVPHLTSNDSVQQNTNSSHQSLHINTDKALENIEAAPIHDNHKESSAFEITRSGITIFVIALATTAIFSYIGVTTWKKIMLRRSGREILINEEEFCEECTDSHEIEMNQPQSRNIII